MTLNLDSLDEFKEHFEFEDYGGPLRVVGQDPEIISDLKTLREISNFTLCSYDDKRTPLDINDIALAERIFKPYTISGSIMSDIRHAAQAALNEYINDMISLLEDGRCGYTHVEYLFKNLTGLHVCGSSITQSNNLWSPHIDTNINLELGYDIPQKKIMIYKLDFFEEPYSDVNVLRYDDNDPHKNPLFSEYDTIRQGIKEDITTLNVALTYGHGNYVQEKITVIDIATTQPSNNDLTHYHFYYDLVENRNSLLDYITQQLNHNLVIDLRRSEGTHPNIIIPAHTVHSIEIKDFNVIVDDQGTWLKTYPCKRA